MVEETVRKRNIAVKMNVRTILSGEYVKEEGWNASYLKIGDLNVSRVNVMAVITVKPENDVNSLIVDDGTGELHLRIFENKSEFEKVSIGDCVLIVGRPREYNGGKYVIPEIVKKVDPSWLKVRKKELEALPHNSSSLLANPIKVQEEAKIQKIPATSKQSVEPVEDESPTDKVYSFIKKQDKGDGVDVDFIIEVSQVINAENIVNEFLKNGDIFEIKPGRVKVLE